jgi:hypothetical protein
VRRASVRARMGFRVNVIPGPETSHSFGGNGEV